MLGALWALLNSEVGISLVASGALWLYRRATKKDKRAQRIGEIATQSWVVIENLPGGLKGDQKWLRYVERVVSQMRSEGMKPLSGKEMAAIRALAEGFSRAHKK